MLLDFMQIVEQAGAELAFPTRTVHVADHAVLARKAAQ